MAPVWLGVSGEDAPDAGGARLKEITPDSPAAKAGLKAGDVVKAFDKKEVKTYEAFTDYETWLGRDVAREQDGASRRRERPGKANDRTRKSYRSYIE